LLGPALITASFLLALQQVEPFATHLYLFAWCGLIFTFDRVIGRIEGRSLIARCGPAFLLVVVWSSTTWFFFELLNLRLENWYYVFTSDRDSVRMGTAFIAFGTVFPAVFWIEHALALKNFSFLSKFGSASRRQRWCFTANHLRGLQLAGVAALALPLWQPHLFFPLVWSCLALILAPINYRRGIDGLLRQLERGDYKPIVRMLLVGLVAGLFWEFFNFWARAKWIYTVPFFDELKLFEMPLAGFIGFPPFALECACVYRFLVWHRLAPAFGAYTQQTPRPLNTAIRSGAVLAAVVASVAVYRGMDGRTIASLTPRTERATGLDETVRRYLLDEGVDYLTQLEGGAAQVLWGRMEERLGPEQTTAARGVAALYLHQGIGVEWGNLLVRAGVRSLGDLRGRSANEVLAIMSAVSENGKRLPRRSQIRVWLRRLPP
jgi:hypothetical protein